MVDAEASYGKILGFDPNVMHVSFFLTISIGVIILLWSIILMSTAGCKDFTGAMVNRFFLGCLEAAVT